MMFNYFSKDSVMYRIAICDDIFQHLESIRKMVRKYFSSHGQVSYEISIFSSPRDLIAALDNGSCFELFILDIIMPESLGTDVAKTVHARFPEAGIIFTSISRDYAVEAYDLGALHYVVKPVAEKSFFRAMDRALAFSRERMPKKIVLHLKGAVVQNIDCDDIIYIESIEYRRVVHTKNGVYEEIRMSLGALLEELERLCPGRFFIPYRGYIVSLDEISTITPGHIIMSDGSSIIIKKGDYRRIRNSFFQWMFSSDRESSPAATC